jgi:hypothetical protein
MYSTVKRVKFDLTESGTHGPEDRVQIPHDLIGALSFCSPEIQSLETSRDMHRLQSRGSRAPSLPRQSSCLAAAHKSSFIGIPALQSTQALAGPEGLI